MRSPRRPAPLTSTESSGWNPLIARKIAGLRVRAGVGWGRRPFLLMVSRLESPDVMLPYLLGAILSRSVSYPCVRGSGCAVVGGACNGGGIHSGSARLWLRTRPKNKTEVQRMSVVTHPTPLRTPPEPGPKVLDGGAAELWGIVGRACVWRQDF